MAPSGMAVTPHHLASESALSVLRHGGDAIEAMVAAAATIAVAYPHMNGIGGDGFWLIVPPDGEPLAIDASGAAGQHATREFYAGHAHIPHRGTLAALTVPGTLSGWDEALKVSAALGGGQLPLSRLLADAIRYAADGIPVTQSQASATQSKYAELVDIPGFADTFLPQGHAPQAGSRFCQPKLARTLTQLATEGLDSFYRGPLAQLIAGEMQALGLPVTAQDLANHRAQRRVPLKLSHSQGEIFNMTPPTQGLVSLAILGITDHLEMAQASEVQTIHVLWKRPRRLSACAIATSPIRATSRCRYRACWNKRRWSSWRPALMSSAPRPGARGKGRAIPCGWGLSIKMGWRCRLSRAFTTNLAAAWCCRKVACCCKTAARPLVSIRRICWR